MADDNCRRKIDSPCVKTSEENAITNDAKGDSSTPTNLSESASTENGEVSNSEYYGTRLPEIDNNMVTSASVKDGETFSPSTGYLIHVGTIEIKVECEKLPISHIAKVVSSNPSNLLGGESTENGESKVSNSEYLGTTLPKIDKNMATPTFVKEGETFFPSTGYLIHVGTIEFKVECEDLPIANIVNMVNLSGGVDVSTKDVPSKYESKANILNGSPRLNWFVIEDNGNIIFDTKIK